MSTCGELDYYRVWMRRLLGGTTSSLSPSWLLNGHTLTMCFSVSWNEIQRVTLSAHLRMCDTQRVSILHKWLNPLQTHKPLIRKPQICTCSSDWEHTENSNWDGYGHFSSIFNNLFYTFVFVFVWLFSQTQWRFWHVLVWLGTEKLEWILKHLSDKISPPIPQKSLCMYP